MIEGVSGVWEGRCKGAIEGRMWVFEESDGAWGAKRDNLLEEDGGAILCPTLCSDVVHHWTGGPDQDEAGLWTTSSAVDRMDSESMVKGEER